MGNRTQGKEESNSQQQAPSTAQIRQDRQRRVTAILRFAGFSVAGGSGLAIAHQLWQGNPKRAMSIALITFAATILAIALLK